MLKLGFGERRVEAPQNAEQLMGLLSSIIAAAVNNEVDLENAKVALNATTRLVEVWQADTRMKSVALKFNKTLENAKVWQMLPSSEAQE